MFYLLKGIVDPDEVKLFSVPYYCNTDLEPKMIKLYNKYYDYLVSKYPFNKKLSDDEFFQISKGVFIAFLAGSLSEEESKYINMYHLYIIKLCYTFCIAWGFHINNEYAEFLDKIMKDLETSKLNKEILNEFNNNLDLNNTPICDCYIIDNGFIGNLNRQNIRYQNKNIMIMDLKRLRYENLEILKLFLIADNFIEPNQKINLFYRKYVKWCKKWVRQTKPQTEHKEEIECNNDNEEYEKYINYIRKNIMKMKMKKNNNFLYATI